jgi:Polyketide cyclase / dehydrase and lipid transport
MRLTKTIRVDTPPAEAWRVVGDLSAVDRWIPGVVGAIVEGNRRLCETVDGGQIVEQITSYSADDRSYGYAHVQQPLPIRNSRGTLSVRTDGDGSMIVWDAEFDTPSPEIAELVEGAYRQTLESLGRLLQEPSRNH